MDKVEIIVRAGDGGNGMASFRREKFVPLGGPDGGDGGTGGNVYIGADRGVANLNLFRHKRRFKAISGGSGGKQKKHGRNGDDLTIRVPLGTMVFLKEGDQEVLLADLSEQGQVALVARGGRGGLGNVHFATSTNQAPRTATKGGRGEERTLILDLKLIADVGIIGYPNVGKSTLLAAVSKAKPKVADYPFTTCEPILGLVEVGMKSFVLGEIPGLIDGAHLGKGLGHEFLRHAERTKLLLHLVDGSSSNPVSDMDNLNAELALYKQSLAQTPQRVAVNKTDLPQIQARLPEIKQTFKSLGVTVFFISAVTKQGVPELMSAVAEMVERFNKERAMTETPAVIFRPKPKAKRG